MSPQEAAKLLAAFSSAFGRSVDEQAAQLWYQSTLHKVDYSVAMRVADRIVSEDTRFPTPARFTEVRRAIERDQEQPYKALPQAPPSTDERARVQQIVADIRKRLNNPPDAA